MRNQAGGRHGMLLCLSAGVCSSACSGIQSALAPAGRDAEQIADLFWWMAAGAGIVWLAVIALGMYAVLGPARPHSQRGSRRLIVIGGIVVPTLVLAVLLLYGLALMPRILSLPAGDGVKIAVSGEQWWWRVRYLRPDGRWIDSANEIRLPVNHRTELVLDSPDVIHSLWIPSLAGKMDMIPGRVTRLAVEPTRTGRFRGQCAEFCGASHAFMAFYVEVMEPEAFDAWLEAQAQPAEGPPDAASVRGESAFGRSGCGACHTVRGTHANGTVGPDLTHVGSRLSIGAGILPNEPDDLRRWLRETTALKPGVHMPAFGMLPPGDVEALAAYLKGLR